MAPPATVSVFNILRDSTGVAIANESVRCVLNGQMITVVATGDAILAVQQITTTDIAGRYAFTVVPNDLLSPANTTYTIVEPNRAYDIAPQSSNGATQQTTAANVIVNTPATLAPATSNVTGPLTVAGLLTASAGLAVTGGTTTDTLAVTSGGLSMPGPLTLTTAASRIIPGVTSLSLRNNANSADNLLVTDAGVATVRAGLAVTAGGLTVTAGGLLVSAGGGVINAASLATVQNATVGNLEVRSTDATVGNFTALDFGNTGQASPIARIAAQYTGGGSILTLGTTNTYAGITNTALSISAAGDTTVGARLLLSTAIAKIVPGATSLSHRNNADSADNLIITDAGIATFRNAVSVPSAAGATLPTTNYGTVPVKIDEQTAGGAVATLRIPASGSLPTGFRHLWVVWAARCDQAADQNMEMTVHGDAGANYFGQFQVVNNATISGVPETAQAFILMGVIHGTGIQAGAFTQGHIYIYNYNSVTFFRNVTGTTRRRSGAGDPAAADEYFYNYNYDWKNTASAIDFFTLFAGAGNLIAGSVVTTYGIP